MVRFDAVTAFIDTWLRRVGSGSAAHVTGGAGSWWVLGGWWWSPRTRSTSYANRVWTAVGAGPGLPR